MKKTLIAAALSLGLSTASFAGFVGPSSYEFNTIKAVKEHAKDDTHVTLTGHIIKQVGDDKYTFKDATGEITVKIKSRYFPSQDITPATKIKLTGEVDKDMLEATKIKAEKPIEILK
ncbi:hypothetical protein BGC07_03530 [Piscirickettsia litoralis]|uniref:Bacterial OB-fold domain-containing protein n=2 Tax=Piscirickettsia litoralis TaxID=1891921 RepID=A0ABX3ACT5_9GAMM|nr:hypothetical protein BGC07_03530 [Piscirickettsia litoralis]